MRALWLEDNTLAFRRDIPTPHPLPDEALVRVHLAGICTTDLELIKGYYPFTGILGHEFVGEIIDANDPDRIGERVVGNINMACKHCNRCLAQDYYHCERRTVLGIHKHDGAFADYLRLPLDNLVTIPDTLSDQAAVFAEPLAAALEIQEQRAIHPTDKVLIIGAGRLGQLIAQTLLLTGCYLQVVARYPKQRQLLAAHNIICINENAVAQRSFTVVIEATGSPTGFTLARSAVRPGGTIVLKSTYAGEISVNLSTLVVDEIHLIGSRCGPLAPALRLLDNRLVNPIPLIDYHFTLDDGLQAFKQAVQPGILKVLLHMIS